MGCNAHYRFFFNQIIMANNKLSDGMEYKQRENSWLPLYSSGISMQLFDLKRSFKMAQVKMIWIICDILGIPITLLGIVSNIDNIKSAILAILAISYLMLRGYYYWLEKKQKVRKTELELWHLEQDKQDRINKNKK